MTGPTIIFYLLATFTLVSALLSVTTTRIFRAAIFLLFSLIGVAGLYFWMQYDFLAAAQIIVYVGGITVLIIFSVFLTQQSGEPLPSASRPQKLAAILAAVSGLILVLLQLYQHTFLFENNVEPFAPTVDNIGRQMLYSGAGGYALPFEVISILLLAALVGCIVIAMPSKNTTV